MPTATQLPADVILDALKEARDALKWYADNPQHHVARQALERVEIVIEAAENPEAAAPLYLNKYRCDRCNEEWQDEWDCMCNDRCPKCNAEIEPYESEDV